MRARSIHLERLTGAESKTIDKFLDAALARSPWPAAVNRTALRRLIRHRLAPDASGREPHVWITQEHRRMQGVAALEPLPWDSSLYGLRMARLEWWLDDATPEGQSAAASAMLTPILHACRRQRIDHLAVRVSYGDVGLAQALEARGFRYVDTTVTLTWEAPHRMERAVRHAIRAATVGDVPALQQVAAEAFVSGRVDRDPRLPRPKNRELYRRWIANACRGRSEAVFIATVRGRAVGFICCNRDAQASASLRIPLGFIDLMAVAPRMQGRGIGRALLRAGLAWLSARVKLIEIRTQVSNLVSLALYQQEGFQIMSHGIALPSGHVFHGWLR